MTRRAEMRPPLRGQGIRVRVLLCSQRVAVLAETGDLVEDALGDFPFRGFGNLDDFVVADDGHGVAVRIEADSLT